MKAQLNKIFRSSGRHLRTLGERGIVLPLVLSYALIFTAQITGLTQYASHTQRLVQSQQNYTTAYYLAEAYTEKSVAAIRTSIASTGQTPTAGTLTQITGTPNTYYSGVSYDGNTGASYAGGGGWTQKTLTSGDYAGLNGNTQTINVTGIATDTKGGVTHTATVTQSVEVQLIPIFQFGVFYENDLEILPGANMTFAGPVHTNSDLYVGVGSGSTSTLSFNSGITAHEGIFHTRKDGTTIGTGAVNIMDGASTYQNMNSGGSWLDSDHANWASDSQTRWGGNVQSGVHGVEALTLPLPSSATAHTLIERRVSGESAQIQTQKMDYKAQLRIIDGVIVDANGIAVELRYCSGGATYTGTCPSGQTVVNPISTAQFKNFRENKTVKSTDIDIAKLNSSPAFIQLVANNNGLVVYVSDSRSQGSSTYQDSVRLINGSQLPTKGLTVASSNPMYVKGNFNTVSKQPSGLVSDAFNILSGSWVDANSTNTNLTGKTASATTINTTVITGNKETTSGSYNGGFENIHRMHENWSSRNLTFSGSVVVLYNSQEATGSWIYGGNYYTAPNRVWSFDNDLTDPNYAIPGLPSVYNVAKTSYESV